MECKKQNWKIFICPWDIFRIQSDKTFIGLHAEGGKSNLSERGPLDEKMFSSISICMKRTFLLKATPVGETFL